MHDKRTGAFGIVAVIFLLLIKYAALNSIPEGQMMLALIVMPVLSRWSMVYALVACPYARPTGLGRTFKEGTGWRRFAVATLIMLAVTIPLFRLAGIVIILGAWVTVLIMAAYLKRKFGGLTGDTYGAINEVAEVAVIIMISLLSNNNCLISA
jgi:adenosylcobinamide-GDP ribazoletransferase